jgi:hypothetical protein
MEEWYADNSIVRTLRTYLADIQIKNLKKVSKKTRLTVLEHIRMVTHPVKWQNGANLSSGGRGKL